MQSNEPLNAETLEKAERELIHRMTDKALEFVIDMGPNTTWEYIFHHWKKKYPTESMFKTHDQR